MIPIAELTDAAKFFDLTGHQAAEEAEVDTIDWQTEAKLLRELLKQPPPNYNAHHWPTDGGGRARIDWPTGELQALQEQREGTDPTYGPIQLINRLWDHEKKSLTQDWQPTPKAQMYDPEDPPDGVKTALTSMHELDDQHPAWLESQLGL